MASNMYTILFSGTNNTPGGGTVKNTSGAILQSKKLSTIHEVSSQREGSLNNMNNNLNNQTNIMGGPPTSSGGGSNNRPIVTSQPPDLIVHSTNAGNWQEHSFDSSIGKSNY